MKSNNKTSFRPDMKVIVDHMPTLAMHCLFSQSRQSEFFGIPYRQTFCVFRQFYSKRDDQQCVYEETGECPYLLPLETALKQGSFEDQINE